MAPGVTVPPNAKLVNWRIKHTHNDEATQRTPLPYVLFTRHRASRLGGKRCRFMGRHVDRGRNGWVAGRDAPAATGRRGLRVWLHHEAKGEAVCGRRRIVGTRGVVNHYDGHTVWELAGLGPHDEGDDDTSSAAIVRQ